MSWNTLNIHFSIKKYLAEQYSGIFLFDPKGFILKYLYVNIHTTIMHIPYKNAQCSQTLFPLPRELITWYFEFLIWRGISMNRCLLQSIYHTKGDCGGLYFSLIKFISVFKYYIFIHYSLLPLIFLSFLSIQLLWPSLIQMNWHKLCTS